MRWQWTVSSTAGIPDPSRERADKLVLYAFNAQLESDANDGDEDEAAPSSPLSRSRLHSLMEEGRVTVGGRPIKANAHLAPGTVVEIEIPAPIPLEAKAENLPLDVLFEDSHIVVINKAPAMTVHPSPTQVGGTLVNALLFHVKDLSGIGGKLRPGIVHRLDKDTSGVMVVSKTDEAHRALVATFSVHAIERRYWALCFGCPRDRAGTIDTLIGRHPQDRKRMTTQVKQGRKAITRYRVLESYGHDINAPFASWVEATLETGRTHQVRVHLTQLGHSLLGDPVYGTPTSRQPKWLALPEVVREAVAQLPGQALHARVLGFEHPVTKEKLRFEAPPPPALKEVIHQLERFRFS